MEEVYQAWSAEQEESTTTVEQPTPTQLTATRPADDRVDNIKNNAEVTL